MAGINRARFAAAYYFRPLGGLYLFEVIGGLLISLMDNVFRAPAARGPGQRIRVTPL